MFKKKKKLFDLKRTANQAKQSPPVRDDRRYHPPRRMFGWRGGIQRRAARKQSLAVICLIAFLTLGAWGAVSAASHPANTSGWGVFSSIAKLFGLAESKEETAKEAAQPDSSMQLSKEYVYAGARMLAIEDYGLSGTSTPTPTPTPTQSLNTAVYVRTDTSTQGNWIGVYGGQGYQLAADGASLPGWAQVLFTGQSEHIWSGSTPDTRALKKVANNADRIASCWYTGSPALGASYTVSFNFTDGQEHQLSFYSLDWDSYGPRSQHLQILDSSTGAILDTQSISNFVNGVYTIWKVKGQVTVKVTNQLADRNAVVGGFFIDDPNATTIPTPTPVVSTPTPTPTPATPTPTPTPAPAVPSIASITANADPTCLDITLNGVSGADSYNVKLLLNGHTVNVTSVSFPWCGLSPSTYYEYQAQAVNQYGMSGWSGIVGGTTANPPPTPTPTPVAESYTASIAKTGLVTWTVNWTSTINRPANTDYIFITTQTETLISRETAGGTSGSFTLYDPLEPGDYQIRYMKDGTTEVYYEEFTVFP